MARPHLDRQHRRYQTAGVPHPVFSRLRLEPRRNPRKTDTCLYTPMATRQFGPTQAPAIAGILTKYTQYNARRKPELLSPDTYSLQSYREAETITGDYKQLADKATAIGHKLAAEYADAYYQLVLYPVLASANLNELYYTVAKNHLYAAQGRAMTNELAAKADSLFRNDSLLAHVYNNDISAGKWSHMMDQTHIGYTSWQEPRYNKEPTTDTIDLAASSNFSWGLAVEGSPQWWPEEKSPASLPPFNPYDHNDHFIDVFNRRSAPFSYTVKANAPWIIIGRKNQSVTKEERLWIGIDWSKLPRGSKTVHPDHQRPRRPARNSDRPPRPAYPRPTRIIQGIPGDRRLYRYRSRTFRKSNSQQNHQLADNPRSGQNLVGYRSSPPSPPRHKHPAQTARISNTASGFSTPEPSTYRLTALRYSPSIRNLSTMPSPSTTRRHSWSTLARQRSPRLLGQNGSR